MPAFQYYSSTDSLVSSEELAEEDALRKADEQELEWRTRASIDDSMVVECGDDDEVLQDADTRAESDLLVTTSAMDVDLSTGSSHLSPSNPSNPPLPTTSGVPSVLFPAPILISPASPALARQEIEPASSAGLSAHATAGNFAVCSAVLPVRPSTSGQSVTQTTNPLSPSAQWLIDRGHPGSSTGQLTVAELDYFKYLRQSLNWRVGSTDWELAALEWNTELSKGAYPRVRSVAPSQLANARDWLEAEEREVQRRDRSIMDASTYRSNQVSTINVSAELPVKKKRAYKKSQKPRTSRHCPRCNEASAGHRKGKKLLHHSLYSTNIVSNLS